MATGHSEICTHGSVLSIVPISLLFTHIHYSVYTLVPMTMQQPWRIRVFRPPAWVNQTKQSTAKPCAYFRGYTVSQGNNSDGTNYCNCTGNGQISYWNKIVGSNTAQRLLSWYTAAIRINLWSAGPERWRGPNLYITVSIRGWYAIIPARL